MRTVEFRCPDSCFRAIVTGRCIGHLVKGVASFDTYVYKCSFLVKFRILELGEASFGYFASKCFLVCKPGAVMEYAGW